MRICPGCRSRWLWTRSIQLRSPAKSQKASVWGTTVVYCRRLEKSHSWIASAKTSVRILIFPTKLAVSLNQITTKWLVGGVTTAITLRKWRFLPLNTHMWPSGIDHNNNSKNTQSVTGHFLQLTSQLGDALLQCHSFLAPQSPVFDWSASWNKYVMMMVSEDSSILALRMPSWIASMI